MSGVRAAILDLALRRGRATPLCPSEMAKTLEPEDWRALMPEVRRVAAAIPEIVVTQGRTEVGPLTARGPIRLRLRQDVPTCPFGTGRKTGRDVDRQECK